MESEVADLELPKEVAHCGVLHALLASLNERLVFSMSVFITTYPT